MSEQKDHTSEETEADESADNHNNEQSKTDVSMLNNQSEAPMLEDEEMPTYISVSGSSKRDDSDVCNAKREERVSMEEDRSPNSIYVLSSVEDSDHCDSNEDDVEYGDSDDVDEMDAEDELVMRSRGSLLDDEEEEDEEDNDEENPLRLPNDDEDESDCEENPLRMSHEDDDDDDDIDEDYEPRCSDRASDDFILNNRLKPCHKERSLSLQDLTICKNNVRSPRNKKRLSLNIMRQNYLGLQPNPAIYPVIHRKQSMPLRYQHVESKVKRYIKDIKERSKRSLGKRFKDEQHVALENHMEDENNDIEHLAPMATNKIIKDYAENAIKDLQQDENSEGNLLYNVPRVVENGENNKMDEKSVDNQYKYARLEKDMDTYCKTIQKEKNSKNRDDRLEKRNGSLDVHYGQYHGTVDRNTRFNVMNQPSLANGHQPALSNIHSVSYEEYMHSGTNTDEKNELPEQEHPEDAEIINVPEIDSSNASCPLKIENVKSIRMSDESENSNFTKTCQVGKSGQESIEIDHLKIRLTQKTAQYDSLRDVYQKTLAENISMKQELEALKKSLAKYESENKSCETKVVSVQTEIREMPIVNQVGTVKVKDTDNKASTSSVASTISSIERWADSDCSPAISIKPPDLTTVLNSDDSSMFTNGTPRKTAHAISRTFLTSSRILQTLSNITQGKTKSESPLVRNPKKRSNDNSTDPLLNADHNSSIQPSSSKKRKATDMLGTSTTVQPFKIPHTMSNSEKKTHTTNTDAEFNCTNEHTNSKSKTEKDPIVTSVNSSENISCTENKEEEMDDHDDSVKCFVYREDENSVNQSFLIQAEEPTKHTLPREKGRIQECGPYLLGNLEVRMSEINGTISVWGKEINQEPITDNDGEMETSTKTQNQKTSHCWPNSPQTRFNGSSIVCSTNKRQKIPGRFNGSHIFDCSHSSPLNAIKSHFLTDDICDQNCTDSPSSRNARVSTCETCDTVNSRQIWQTCKRNSNLQDKIHSCCTHRTTDKECSCGSYRERQKRDDSPNRSKDKFSMKGIRRGSCKNTTDSNKHMHESSEVFCKYNRACGHSLENAVENCQQYSKSCNTVRDNSCTCKSAAHASNQENTYRNTCNRSPSNHGDEDPLISCTRSNETSEMRQRRLSGKRVRGILMDLLRGCGDCRNTSGGDQSNVKEKEIPYLANGPPQIKITSCDKSEPSCSNRTQCSERCCHTCARRIETQLEEFRMEMERVRSRSDAILDMLSMLHSVDMN